MQTYTIYYDYCPDDGYDEKNLQEDFTGTWDELQNYIVQMRINGCYNINAVAHETEGWTCFFTLSPKSARVLIIRK